MSKAKTPKPKQVSTPAKVNTCDACGFVAKNSTGLKRHVSAKHSDVAKPTKTTKSASKPKVKRKSKGRKFNHDHAFAWYLEDATRSYADVAKQYGVTKKTVEQAAKVTLDDNSWCTWAERRQMLGDEARKKAEEEYRKSVPVRNEEHLKQYRNLQIATSNKIALLANQGTWVVNPQTGQKFKVQEFDARQLADVAKALKIAIDGERVIMGLATSVATIKPGENDKGQGWGELLAMAMDRVAQEGSDNEQ